MKPTPIPLMCAICDEIVQDHNTKKFYLLGMFSMIHHAPEAKFPLPHGKMGVFFMLTSGRGEYESRLRIVRSSTDEEIFVADGKMSFPGPHAVVEIPFMLYNVAFPEPGDYYVQLLCQNEILIQRKISVCLPVQQAPNQFQ